jgi:hypothetical protein
MVLLELLVLQARLAQLVLERLVQRALQERMGLQVLLGRKDRLAQKELLGPVLLELLDHSARQARLAHKDRLVLLVLAVVEQLVEEQMQFSGTTDRL